jgi:SAM-dependent methyltransferase
MDRCSYNEMAKLVDIYTTRGLVADIGSKDVNGSYKNIFDKNLYRYVGFDLESGNNVDIVMLGEYNTGCPSHTFDVVISGNTIEHSRNPFKLFDEMVWILKPGGIIIVSIPQVWGIHRYPIDCWRVNPDGMAVLFEESGIEPISIYTKSQFTLRHGVLKQTYGVGLKTYKDKE